MTCTHTSFTTLFGFLLWFKCGSFYSLFFILHTVAALRSLLKLIHRAFVFCTLFACLLLCFFFSTIFLRSGQHIHLMTHQLKYLLLSRCCFFSLSSSFLYLSLSFSRFYIYICMKFIISLSVAPFKRFPINTYNQFMYSSFGLIDLIEWKKKKKRKKYNINNNNNTIWAKHQIVKSNETKRNKMCGSKSIVWNDIGLLTRFVLFRNRKIDCE